MRRPGPADVAKDGDGGPIRIAALDDHAAVLAGLQRLVERSTDLQPVAFVRTERELRSELDRKHADVVVVDHDLARGDGLAVCQRLKVGASPPRVVLYSAYAGPSLAIATHIVRADGLIHKSQPISDLLSTIRRVASGRTVLPPIEPGFQQAAMARLDKQDLVVAELLLAGATHRHIAETLDVGRQEIADRERCILRVFAPRTAGAAAHALDSVETRVRHVATTPHGAG